MLAAAATGAFPNSLRDFPAAEQLREISGLKSALREAGLSPKREGTDPRSGRPATRREREEAARGTLRPPLRSGFGRAPIPPANEALGVLLSPAGQ